MPGTAEAVERAAAERFIEDPAGFFDLSLTAMESIDRAELEALQREAMSLRFATQRQRIPMLAKLSDAQGIASVDDFDEVVPLLFEHTTYKSYPASLLAKGRFVDLTRWLDKLTPHDLSSVELDACESIDDWLGQLCAQTELDPLTSSGTTGTMSFIPRDRGDWYQKYRTLRVLLLQEFRQPVDETERDAFMHVIWPTYADGRCTVFRAGQFFKKYFAGDRDDLFHPLYPSTASTDLMYLAAKLRSARGGRVDVPAHLLARRDEMERMQRDMGERIGPFVQELVKELDGERVIGSGTSHLYYDVAMQGIAAGLQCRFAPGSVLFVGGGAKGMTLADDWEDVVRSFFGRIVVGYSMTELTILCTRCEHRRFHVPPWIVPFVLDPDTSKPLPRHGVQRGRAAYFDLVVNGIWGGLITGDEIELDFDEPCRCGRTSLHLADRVERFSEKQGGTDKITCAATPQAHADALDFLVAT